MSVDADGDGSDATVDCNDMSDAVHPGAMEVCADGIDADCDGIDPACTTPRMDGPDPLVDDPGFDWNPEGDPVYTRPAINTLHGTGCSASPGARGNALWLFGFVFGALTMRRKRAR